MAAYLVMVFNLATMSNYDNEFNLAFVQIVWPQTTFLGLEWYEWVMVDGEWSGCLKAWVLAEVCNIMRLTNDQTVCLFANEKFQEELAGSICGRSDPATNRSVPMSHSLLSAKQKNRRHLNEFNLLKP